MEKKTFDVFIIGSGVAGRTVAEACAKQNMSVAVADNRAFGGTCANRGCDPKKVILGVTEALELSKHLQGKGIAELPTLNWKTLMQFKKTFTGHIPQAVEHELDDLGITLYHQTPKFTDENTLAVEGETVKAKKIVIATGCVPRTLNIEGRFHLKTSEDFMEMKKLPKRMVFLGAGYIGMEFAHMAARCGVKVTVIEHGASILKPFDADLASELLETSKALGIKFIFNAEISSLEKLTKKYRIYYTKNGDKYTLKAGAVFNTTGRVPAIGALDLEKGKVAYSKAGVVCNAFMQNKTNPNVYACGDVSAHGLPLSPLSGIEANIVSKNIIKANVEKIELPVIPSVVFTLPNLATVGLQEEEAKSRYKNIIVNYKSATDWYNAKRINAPSYTYKIIINERTDLILGAHILGPHAAETINLFAMAIQKKMTTQELKAMIFTYPTWANDIKSML